MSFVTRFAPSPTGHLHLGSAYSALVAFDAARSANGRFLLRVEDIDRGRCRASYERALYEDLAWLGLQWDTPPRRQSDHLPDYQAALARLIAMGAVYRCFKTRREILDEIARAPHHGLGEGPDGVLYVGDPDELSDAEAEERIAAGDAYAWRLSIRRVADILADRARDLVFREEWSCAHGAGDHAVDFDRIGDAVLARKDAGTSYHLACTHDDALQGVTHVIRGEDLFAAVHLHRTLQALMEWPTPVYRHHPLIRGVDGARLSKRDGALAIRALREGGAAPADIRARLGI